MSALIPSIKVGSLPISTSNPPSSESNLTKKEQSDNSHTVDIPPPPFINSINELRSLSTALSTFFRRYDELHNHIDSIKSSIDSKLPNHLLNSPNPNQPALTPLIEPYCDRTAITVSEPAVSEQSPNGSSSHSERSHEIVMKLESPESSKKSEETDISKEPEETDTSTKPEETDTLTKPGEIDNSKQPEEIDISEKRAVSELEGHCERMCGKSVKRYVTSHISSMNKLREELPKAMRLARDPAKLVLDGVGRFFITGSRAYSKDKRLVVGRLASVLILECFVMMSNDGIEIAKEHETYAAEAATDWRKRLINEGGLGKSDEVDARGLLLLISGFGIPKGVFKNEDIRDMIRVSNVKEISLALRRSINLIPRIPEVINWMVKNNLEIEAADVAYTFGLEDKCHPEVILTTFLQNTIKDKPHGSSAQVKESKKKQLSDLRSLRKCFEAHNLDLTKLLPNFQINEKIQQLEKEISKVDPEEKATRKRKEKESKPSRNPKQQEPKRNRVNSDKNTSHEQHNKAIYHYNNSPIPQPSNNYYDRNPPTDYITTYGQPSSGFYGQPSSGFYGQPYGIREDPPLVERYLGQPYSRQGQPYDLQPSTSGLIDLYLNKPSLESFPGYPTSSPSGRGGRASDLYGFADTVDKIEYYRGSRASGSGTVRSSNLY